MTKSQNPQSRSTTNPAGQIACAIALCAMAMGAIGTIVNQWLIGWVVIVVMSAVCLGFMAFGLLILVTRASVIDSETKLNARRLTARADKHHDVELLICDGLKSGGEPHAIRRQRVSRHRMKHLLKDLMKHSDLE